MERKATELEAVQSQSGSVTTSVQNPSLQSTEPCHSHSISFSLPPSASGLHLDQTRRFSFNTELYRDKNPNLLPVSPSPELHSQTMVAAETEVSAPKDTSFDSFKTWSGRPDNPQNTEMEILPVDRYFDALEGPELDKLKPSEGSVLPEDKQWPFLLRFPISSFGVCLGISSQAILWKTLATSQSVAFLHINLSINLVLWCISLTLTTMVFLTYSMKAILFFEAVKREYQHPIRVNFFFAPWIACLFLAIGLPPSVTSNLHTSVWYILMTPILILELKIYGQWMSGGQRRLSKVANPSNHLSIVGNFVGALLGASMGLREGPIFFFAVGLAHYVVLFVTLYQRLPTTEALPKELHPVFFLFVAAPSVACTAWAKIRGDFDYGSKMTFFVAMFLYFSLAVRVNFFRGFRFSLAWWAYTFPMTGASIATIRYSMEMKNLLTQSLSVLLSAVSTLTVTALLVTTVVHAFILKDLFPNDISIAITERKQKKKGKKRGSGSLRSATTVEASGLECAITVNVVGQQLSS